MEKNDHLKCACADCGHIIEYLPAAIGQTVKCPKCGEKSLLPPPPPAAAETTPSDDSRSDSPPPKKCRTCGAKLSPGDFSCPACAAERRRQRAVQFRIVAVIVTLAAIAVIAAIAALVHFRRRPDPNAPFVIKGAVEGPLPQPKVPTPRSLNDLKVGTFVIGRRGEDRTSPVTGDIENISDNVHYGVTVELDLFDAQGTKVGVLKESIVSLGANMTWHVISKTPNPNAKSVRVAGIRETQ